MTIKVPKPTFYTGKGADHTLAKLYDWQDSIEAYVKASGGTLQDDGVLVASCYLSEDAKLWYRAWAKDTKDPKGKAKEKTYNQLIEDMTKQFIPSTSDNILQAQWERIHQYKDGKIQPITKIAAELSSLALQLPDMTDFTKKQWLFGAMIPELQALVEPQCKWDAAWEEIIKLAERHDAALYQARKQSKEKHRSPNLRKL